MTQRNRTAVNRVGLSLVLGIVLSGGCGTSILQPARFPNSVLDANGEPLSLEELEAIANDADLTEQQKRDRFAELGIEDPDLIEVLLDL